MIKRNFWNYIFIFSIFLFDRISKIMMIKFLDGLPEKNVYINSFLNLNLIWNDGIAFGLFSFNEKIYYNILTVVIIIITIIIFWMIHKTKNFEKFAFMMIFGGSLGNIFDRIYYSSVPDFIDFHVNNLHWFIFNVADIFISLGVIMLICLEIFLRKKT